MIRRKSVFSVKISLLAIKPTRVIIKNTAAPITAPTKYPRWPIFLDEKNEVKSVPIPNEIVAKRGRKIL